MPLFMSLMEFAEAFPSESEFVERKSGFNRTAVQEAAVAFSNADGGVILIGVDDDGAIVGRGAHGPPCSTTSTRRFGMLAIPVDTQYTS